MLAERFTEVTARLTAAASERQQARAARDAFIAAQWPVLDAALAAMVRTVCGAHPRLAVVQTTVTEVVANRGFPSLDGTITEVRSTLYGPVEVVRFIPALESALPNQFGVVRVETEGLSPRFPSDAQGARFRSILERGIALQGAAAASLAVSGESGYEPLTAELLEGFLAALLVRTD